MSPDSAQLMHSLLIPGILIIASSILLFSTNSRYALIVDRIRLLKSERKHLEGGPKTETGKGGMRDNIELQISHLIHRIYLIRITVVSFSAAILFFAVSCVLSGLRSNFIINSYYWLITAFLFAGLLSIINGVIFSVIEVFKAYRIVRIEISEKEN